MLEEGNNEPCVLDRDPRNPRAHTTDKHAESTAGRTASHVRDGSFPSAPPRGNGSSVLALSITCWSAGEVRGQSSVHDTPGPPPVTYGVPSRSQPHVCVAVAIPSAGCCLGNRAGCSRKRANVPCSRALRTRAVPPAVGCRC